MSSFLNRARERILGQVINRCKTLKKVILTIMKIELAHFHRPPIVHRKLSNSALEQTLC